MMLSEGLACVACVLAAVVVPPAVYLGWLTLRSQVRPAPAAVDAAERFVIVVPAHNEAANIGDTVANLRGIDYPAELFAVLVVADNCDDSTALHATEAGATVLQRRDPDRRGKGYALEFAFEHILDAGWAAAVVVVDADTVVTPNLLRAFAARLQQGASAVQAEYGVRNPQASWRTRLMTVALTMFHRVRSLGRESLGVSAGLRGNGMCFTCELLRQHPHRAFGLVEDVEYSLILGRAGIRVVYADEARVLGEMVAGAAAAQSQRRRWEGGRLQLVRSHVPSLLAGAVRRRSGVLLDLALDLLVPPLSTLGLLLMLGVSCEVVHGILTRQPSVAAPFLGVAIGCVIAYVGRGVQLSGLGWSAVAALLWAPVYIVWKLFLKLKPGGKSTVWVRTRRENERVS